MEQERAPEAVRFLRDVPPSQCQGEENDKEHKLLRCVGGAFMQACKDKGNEEVRGKLPKERLQFSQESIASPMA